MLAAIATAVALMTVPGGVAIPSPQPAPSAAAGADSCAVSPVRQALEHSEAWRNLRGELDSDPGLHAAFEAQMPGYRLAFRHRPSAGVLLIGARELDEPAAGSEAFWNETAAAAARACARSGTDCTVEPLAQSPYGLQASTLIEAEPHAVRRETLAFSDSQGCGYSVQFTGEETQFSSAGWEAVRSALRDLRGLLVPARQSRR